MYTYLGMLNSNEKHLEKCIDDIDASSIHNQYLITFSKKVILTYIINTVVFHCGLSHISFQFIIPMFYSSEVYRNSRLFLKPFIQQQIVWWSDQIRPIRVCRWKQNQFQIALYHCSKPFYSEVTIYSSWNLLQKRRWWAHHRRQWIHLTIISI